MTKANVKFEVKTIKATAETTAQAYLELLSLRGVDYFFANAGTDFASIVDAFACSQARGKETPIPMLIPHEIPLVSIAHGYYLATGKPQVAMVHVGVGTANGLGGIMNAYRSRVPIIFSAGCTPVAEKGGSVFRVPFLHWGQESFDQAGMVREYVKWDYELRDAFQLETVVDRAFTIALTEPKGPVYLVLPPEVMISPVEEMEFSAQPRYDLPTFHPDPSKLQEAAGVLARAKFPLVITSSIGRASSAVQALMNLAEIGAVGVVSFNSEYMNFPYDHYCYQGLSPDPYLREVDVILVVDCDVPWYPGIVKPKESAVIIQVGIDPLYSNYPLRGFPSDITLQGDPARVLSGISGFLARHPDKDEGLIEARKTKLLVTHNAMLESWDAEWRDVADDKPLDFRWISHNVAKILDDNTFVVNEYDNGMHQQVYRHPGSYFGSPRAGYLGWGIGAALGIKLALKDGVVIVTVGDGSYMFSVPSACHFVSNMYQLPILIIVYNNQCWNAVKWSTRALHPDGWAARNNRFPLCDFNGTADYEKICEAFGGYGERVTDPDQVEPSIKRALYVVKHEKRQALLNIICKNP